MRRVHVSIPLEGVTHETKLDLDGVKLTGFPEGAKIHAFATGDGVVRLAIDVPDGSVLDEGARGASIGLA